MPVSKHLIKTVFIALLGSFLTSLDAQVFAAVKDQSRIGQETDIDKPVEKNKPLFPIGPEQDQKTVPEKTPASPDENNGNDRAPEGEEPAFDINEIPALEKIELTLDVAKRAIDAFAFVGHRYDDRGLIDYPTIEEFVEKTEAGKELAADVKKYGFDNITAWNTAIMNVSFGFGAVTEKQDEQIQKQIETVKQDKELAEDKKTRIIASLNALIPSKGNIDIIKQLLADPVYKTKLQLLNAFE